METSKNGGMRMSKVAIILAPGFEEIEALTTVDILRRASIECDIVGFSEDVEGAHAITVKTDKVLDDSLSEYHLIILPGGMPGAANLRDNEKVIQALKKMNEENKPVAAICAAPIVLEKAGLLEGKNYTAFPGFEDEINSGNHKEDLVVIDGNIVTSRGPATAFDFAYTLVDFLGGNSEKLKEEMLYSKLLETKN